MRLRLVHMSEGMFSHVVTHLGTVFVEYLFGCLSHKHF